MLCAPPHCSAKLILKAAIFFALKKCRARNFFSRRMCHAFLSRKTVGEFFVEQNSMKSFFVEKKICVLAYEFFVGRKLTKKTRRQYFL